jgi:hypothetical protein
MVLEKQSNDGLQLRRAISIQLSRRKLLEKHASRCQLEGFVGQRIRLATQIEQHPTLGCIDRSDPNNADTEFFAAGNHVIAAIGRLKFA